MIANSDTSRHPLFPASPRVAKPTLLSRLLGKTQSIRIECPAKINLFLHVTGKRDDGYHELQSWIAFAGVSDALTLREAKQYHLVAEGPFARNLPLMADNLVTKTVNLLAERFNKKPNFVVELTKNLPIGAGLGGGSGNAAAAARALQHFWGFEWQADDAAWLAKNIGADVPVCLAGRSCVVTGMGDVLTAAMPMPQDCHIVIVFPSVGVSTAEIFGTMAAHFTPPITLQTEVNNSFDLVKVLQKTRNDLAHPAMALESWILQAHRALTRQPGCLLARMTGSGSACFGIFADAETARNAATTIRQAEPVWWCRATKLLPV